MKKLRVILPAILTLAVSTSAAVTGTVAWFSATRLRTVTMTGITVVNPEQGLKLVQVTDLANVDLTPTEEYTNSTTLFGVVLPDGIIRNVNVDNIHGEGLAYSGGIVGIW